MEKSEKQLALDKVLGRMNKSFSKSASKPTIIDVAKDFDLLRPNYLSTGVEELDRALGGGFVKGGITTLFGKPGGGKSTLAYISAKKLIDTGGTVVYFATEGEKISEALEMLEINEDHPGFIVIRPDGSLEQIMNMIYLLLFDSDKKQLTRAVDMIIFDSINSTVTSSELETFKDNAEKDGSKAGQMARQANAHTQLVKILISQNLLGADTTMLLIAQVRANMSGMGQPWKAAIPVAVEHACKMIIEIKAGATIKGSEKTEDGVKEMKKGHVVVATVHKNSVYGKPGVQTEYAAIYKQGIDDTGSINKKAEEFGYYLKDLKAWGKGVIKVPTSKGDITFANKKELDATVKSSNEFKALLRELVTKKPKEGTVVLTGVDYELTDIVEEVTEPALMAEIETTENE